MANHHSKLVDYVLEKAASEPLPLRVSLYRDLAEFCGDPQESAALLALAAELEVADLRCREFAFQVHRDAALRNGKTKKGTRP